ncbi:MAG: glycosyltransferase family 4 protein [Acidimicrobiia bacterium]|jgi:glycosyltransferase involved in cell wall biosynthesis
MTDRILLLTLSVDDPPRGGVALRSLEIASILAARGPLGVVTLRSSLTRPVLEGVTWYEPDAADALTTLFDPARDPSWLQDEEWDPSVAYLTEGLHRHVASAVADFSPDVVVLDQLYLAGYREVLTTGGARSILNEHNVEADLQEDLAARAVLPPERVLRSRFAARTARLEEAHVQAVDQVWMCSPRDQARIAARYGRSEGVFVIPNALPVPPHRPTREERNDGIARMVFPGDFAYPPNREAAEIIINELVPRLRERLGAFEVILAGRYPSSDMMEAHHTMAEVRVTGPVAEMAPILAEADVLVAPLQAGSGSRFKLLEAFAAGLPVVATPKAAEGLAVMDGTHLVLADEADAMASAVAALTADPPHARLLADAGWQLVRDRYSWRAVAHQVADALAWR